MTESVNEQDGGEELGADAARRAACKIIEILHEAGHVAYLAGGCVRDELLGVEPKDFDVATDAEPKVVRKMFRVTRAVGEAFGVVMVRMYGTWAEVATFRTDGEYEDGRHPKEVAFTDAEHDAKRRDFTINGMYFDPQKECVIDYVDGRADLKAKVIRAIGEPSARFGEDYLRMLRAVRFAARLGFEIDEATGQAIREHAPKLGDISRERVGMEVLIMLGGQGQLDSAGAVGLLCNLELADVVLEEPGVSFEGEDDLVKALNVAGDFVAVLAAWAMGRHLNVKGEVSLEELVGGLGLLKPVQIARRWRGALMLSNEHRDGLASGLATMGELVGWFGLPVAKRKRLLARRDWVRLEMLLHAMKVRMVEGAFDWEGFDVDVAALRAEGVNPKALLSGDGLVEAGMKPGPKFKQILRDVYDAQLEGRVGTAGEALALAQQMSDAG